MKTICAWCSETPVGETVSHGICADCMRTHFPDLADEPANTFAGRVVGNPAKASLPDSYGAEAGCYWPGVGLKAQGEHSQEPAPAKHPNAGVRDL